MAALQQQVKGVSGASKGSDRELERLKKELEKTKCVCVQGGAGSCLWAGW